ncbi:hypothetical protein NGR_c25730 [Sinorhizobium fredii NGR234]|uniref:Transmembrane protein n=1 Tax=Sinorhizobium fredii (strain NBRC 101917 / NGR234) TaxID=394 RepID=C3MH44_SINFN|nr:hypothetical protein [Sinorhizobium fredii]ACP26330.1 hypothetical protein NGR_c25730 [Sinorhizobium fredii NGR234]
MQDEVDEHSGDRPSEQGLATRASSVRHEPPVRQIDPSESVTLFAMALGLIGALVGLVAGLVFLSDQGLAVAILNCLIAILAGGSAGVVTGGTIGAAIAVFRGRVLRETNR